MKVDKTLALITLQVLIEQGTKFNQIFYLSQYERQRIKELYKQRLPAGFANEDRHNVISDIIKPITGKDVYVDGNTYLICNNKCVLTMTAQHTLADIAGVLDIKEAKPWQNKTTN